MVEPVESGDGQRRPLFLGDQDHSPTMVTNLNPQALTAPGMSAIENRTKGPQYTGTIPFGPIMDVVASVSADGSWIELVINVTYVGYDNLPGSGLRPTPHIRFGQATGTVFVPVGQTLLLGTMLKDEPATQAPGQEFPKKRLLVFVTPQIINPSENPRPR